MKRYAAELLSLNMADKLTAEQRKRMDFLRSKLNRELSNNKTKAEPLQKRDLPTASEQLAKIRKDFVKVVEPWTKFKCSVCDTEYHLIDGAGCKCGKDEAEKLYKKHIEDTRWI